ncbi:MAG: fused MFS/spermidine synthase [Burkholderiales bacterium]|nr:fused MFS/spermidine synthase [Burkholderiales bacterium]
MPRARRFRFRHAAAAAVAALLWGCAALDPPVIAERASPFGTIVVTAEPDGLRAMRFGRGGVTQSVARPGDPGYLHFRYARLALAGAALVETPRRMLVVGLGGGSLPMFLRQHYPEATIDAVDVDPAVVAVAREHFGLREDARLRTHVADGRAFVDAAPAGQYDLVILDAYGSERVPEHLTTVEFLGAVRRALDPDGVLVSNLWNGWYNRRYEAMLRTHEAAFAEVHVLDSRQEVNHVVIALARARGLGADALAARAAAAARARGYRFDLGALVAGAYLAPRPRAAEVLRDPPPR